MSCRGISLGALAISSTVEIEASPLGLQMRSKGPGARVHVPQVLEWAAPFTTMLPELFKCDQSGAG